MMLKASLLKSFNCEDEIFEIKRRITLNNEDMLINTVIGIDQSYKRTGVSACRDGKIIYCFSITPEASDCPSDKRKSIINGITNNVIENKDLNIDPKRTIVVMERVRLFSRGFISFDYIVKTGALVAMISDLFYGAGMETYVVDTRAWKKAVVGTSKPAQNKYGLAPEKWPTINYVKHMKEVKNSDILIEYPRQKKGVIRKNDKFYEVNDDLCDAICISKFFFVDGYGNCKNLHKMLL